MDRFGKSIIFYPTIKIGHQALYVPVILWSGRLLYSIKFCPKITEHIRPGALCNLRSEDGEE